MKTRTHENYDFTLLEALMFGNICIRNNYMLLVWFTMQQYAFNLSQKHKREAQFCVISV